MKSFEYENDVIYIAARHQYRDPGTGEGKYSLLLRDLTGSRPDMNVNDLDIKVVMGSILTTFELLMDENGELQLPPV